MYIRFHTAAEGPIEYYFSITEVCNIYIYSYSLLLIQRALFLFVHIKYAVYMFFLYIYNVLFFFIIDMASKLYDILICKSET